MFENNCIIDDTLYSQHYDGIENLIQKLDSENICRMYPDLSDTDDKLILFLDFQFCCNEFPAMYSGNLNICSDNSSIQVPKYEINRPLPNKKYLRTSMKHGHRLSRRGVILLFDSFEELSQIKSIGCLWTVYDKMPEPWFTINDSISDYVAEFKYNTVFEEPHGNNRIYTVLSYDALLQTQRACLGSLLNDKYKHIVENDDNIMRQFNTRNVLLCENDIVVKPYDISLISFYK